MSEAAAEKPHAEKPKGSKESKGKENIFTKRYGPLYGWVWLVIIGGTIILYVEVKKRKAAATAASTTASSTTANIGSTASYDPAQGYGGGYYGGGGSYGGYPGGGTAPSYPSPDGTGTTSNSNGGFNVVVADEIDKQIAQAQGVTADHLFYAGSDPYASKATDTNGYAPAAELPAWNGQPNAIWLGLAGKVAPPGATVVEGADRNQTAQQLAAILKASSGTGMQNGS